MLQPALGVEGRYGHVAGGIDRPWPLARIEPDFPDANGIANVLEREGAAVVHCEVQTDGAVDDRVGDDQLSGRSLCGNASSQIDSSTEPVIASAHRRAMMQSDSEQRKVGLIGRGPDNTYRKLQPGLGIWRGQQDGIA